MIAHLRKILARPAVYRVFGELVGAEPGRRRFVREHVRARPGDRVLDIGCGPADILPHLPAVEYVGFDANPDYITSARARHGSRGTFHCARVEEKTLAEHAGFDIVLAIGLLHHLTDEEATHLCRLAYAALRPGGRFVTLDGCWTDRQSRAARYLLSRDRGEHVRTPEAYELLARTVFPSVVRTVKEDMLRLPYTHAILEGTRPVDGA